jgi:hypothetical protein
MKFLLTNVLDWPESGQSGPSLARAHVWTAATHVYGDGQGQCVVHRLRNGVPVGAHPK